MHPTPLNTEAVGPAESPLPSHTITCSLPRRSAQDWGGGESRTVTPVKSGEPQEAQSTPRTAPRRRDKEACFQLTSSEETDLNASELP